MIFQKPILKIRENYSNTFFISLSVAFLTSYITYGLCVLLGVLGKGGEIKIIDFFNGFAAICTSLAFGLAVWQYRKNIIQQKQHIIAAEAKKLIERMITTIALIKTGIHTKVENLEEVMALLTNISVDFDELYKSMEEDINKAIIRMNWQDMYYNYLIISLSNIDLFPIVRSKSIVPYQELLKIFSDADSQARDENTFDNFRDFVIYSKVLDHIHIKGKINLRAELKSLDAFSYYYLDKKHTNDLMFGLISRIDIRSHAPLLAVAGPKDLNS